MLELEENRMPEDNEKEISDMTVASVQSEVRTLTITWKKIWGAIIALGTALSIAVTAGTYVEKKAADARLSIEKQIWLGEKQTLVLNMYEVERKQKQAEQDAILYKYRFDQVIELYGECFSRSPFPRTHKEIKTEVIKEIKQNYKKISN
jgi:hypothetical protein